MNYREFVANVGRGANGTEAVTVRAGSSEEAHKKLVKFGYKRIANITPL